MSVPDSAVFPVSDMTGTETQTPSVAGDGAAKGAPAEEAPVTVPGAQAALRPLLVDCGYAVVPAPPILAAGLMSARARLVEVTLLKARVAGLQVSILQRNTGDNLLQGETMARISAAQDRLALSSEQVATKRPYSAVETDPPEVAPRETDPSAKHQGRD